MYGQVPWQPSMYGRSSAVLTSARNRTSRPRCARMRPCSPPRPHQIPNTQKSLPGQNKGENPGSPNMLATRLSMGGMRLIAVGRRWPQVGCVVTLVHAHKAPTEGHSVGKQIDEILSDAKAHIDRLKGAARKRKTDTRKKVLGAEELAAKLKAIDEKLARDLADYARTLVNICLPVGRVEVKRERPPPPPPTPAETEKRLRTAVCAAEDAAEVAECDLVAARRCMEKAAARDKMHEKRLALSTSWHIDPFDDEGYERLLAERAVTDLEWKELAAKATQLSREFMDAELSAFNTRATVEEVRNDLAAALGNGSSFWEQSWAALEAKWKQRDAEREAAREAERAAEAAAEQEVQAREDEACEEEAREARRWLEERRAERECEMQREIARAQWAECRPEGRSCGSTRQRCGERELIRRILPPLKCSVLWESPHRKSHPLRPRLAR